ncbi:MAG: GAF domain-containing sensor histidine kinase [Chitinophagaceae bacterium]|nr:GAF domain-containing sensor histidine kinase [Chitinophagaceae bacterium]
MQKRKEPLAQINLFTAPPLIPLNDPLRLKELHSYEILDTDEEDEFNDIVLLAASITKASIAVISLVDTNREWFKAKTGISANSYPRNFSFAAHFLSAENLFFQVSDTEQDERFSDNPLVTGKPNIRFVAGIRLVNKNGYAVGALVVMDDQPGELKKEQIFFLQTLAKQVLKLLEQKMLNKQIQQQRIKLEQQMSLQNRILSIIAHDVRNPVGAVKSIIELSGKKLLSKQDSAALMQMAAKQIDGTVELLNNLVDWGSMQMKGRGFETEKTHLYTLVSNMYKSFDVMASLKSNMLVNLVDDDLFINSEINALSFILRNLISNANKFTNEGVITICASTKEQNIMLSVSDNGVGMDALTCSEILTGQKNESSAGTLNEKGSGLGLVLTKDFVEMLGGTITVESEMGKGTTVYMHFPNSKT